MNPGIASDKPWRIFVALPASEEARRTMQEIQARLKSVEAPVRWEGREKLHMTLRFLGDTAPGQVKPLASALRAALAEMGELKLCYSTLGAFPSVAQPRIIWIGSDAHTDLLEIQKRIDHECTRLGLGRPEERTFHPHITLGRARGPQRLENLTAMLKTLTFEPILDGCAGVQVIRSELQPTGSRYTVLESIPLHP